MSTLKIEQGSTLPAFPGFVSGVDHEGGVQTNPIVAIRIAPAEGRCRDVLNNLNVRTIRIGVMPDIGIRPGDDVLVPASTIRRVQAIELKDRNDPTGQNRVPMYKQDAQGQPVKDATGALIPWLSINVALKAPLQVSQSRVRADQIRHEIDDSALAAANSAW